MEIYVKSSFISIFSILFCFSDLILSDALILQYRASNTTSDDVTN